MGLSVKEMLKRPFFESATVLSGHKGLHKKVSWAHIIEIENFGHLLHGEEVILTTGIGWADDEEKSLAYLQQLLNNNASALCIELVVHVKELPKKMLELAEQHDFPIISFTEEVRFIDITKDLHEQILGQHEDIWIDLEHFHQKLLKTLTTNGTIGDFLRILHQGTNKQIAITYSGQYRFFPSPSAKKQKEWITWMEKHAETGYYAHPIYLLNERIGSLQFLEPLENITKFDELALKRCSETIDQFFWRHHHQIEIKQLEKNKWLLDAIQEPISHKKISNLIYNNAPGVLLQDAIIGIKPEKESLLSADKQEDIETSFMMTFRSILQEHGFELFTVKDSAHRQYILFIINQQSQDMLPRLQEALQEFHSKNSNYFKEKTSQLLGFGKVFSNYNDMDKGYQTALSTLRYQENIASLEQPFYQDLGVYRIIDQFSDKNELTAIITDYIQPLIDHDKEKGTELIKTLHVYLATLGQKNETAAELHIVRQTLYHRLHKIEQLLGADYMLPENRFMIEFALHSLLSNK